MPSHRPRGRLRHVAATLSPLAAVAGRAALERDAGERARRLVDAGRDGPREARRPRDRHVRPGRARHGELGDEPDPAAPAERGPRPSAAGARGGQDEVDERGEDGLLGIPHSAILPRTRPEWEG